MISVLVFGVVVVVSCAFPSLQSRFYYFSPTFPARQFPCHLYFLGLPSPIPTPIPTRTLPAPQLIRENPLDFQETEHPCFRNDALQRVIPHHQQLI